MRESDSPRICKKDAPHQYCINRTRVNVGSNLFGLVADTTYGAEEDIMLSCCIVLTSDLIVQVTAGHRKPDELTMSFSTFRNSGAVKETLGFSVHVWHVALPQSPSATRIVSGNMPVAA